MSEKTIEIQPIQLPPRTRSMIERAVQEQAAMQAMAQQQQQRINDLIEAAREMLDVPAGWVLENTGVGFVPAGDGPASLKPE